MVPLLITCLNDRAWPLRASFFRHIARVGKFVGSAPCEAFLLPCVERCLSDSSDEVVAWALKCLAEMVGGAPPEEHEAHGATNGLAFNNKENETNDETNDETSDGAIKASPNERVGSVLRKRSVVAAARGRRPRCATRRRPFEPPRDGSSPPPRVSSAARIPSRSCSPRCDRS